MLSWHFIPSYQTTDLVQVPMLCAYGLGTPSTPGPLLLAGPGDPAGLQGAHGCEGVIALLLHPAAVHHAHHIVDGDRSLCDVGGQHNLQAVCSVNGLPGRARRPYVSSMMLLEVG